MGSRGDAQTPSLAAGAPACRRQVRPVSAVRACRQERLQEVAEWLPQVSNCRQTPMTAARRRWVRFTHGAEIGRRGIQGTGALRRRCRREPEQDRSRSEKLLRLEVPTSGLLARSARRPDRPRQRLLTDAHHRIDAKRAPRCGELAAGVDPPLLGYWPLADYATLRTNRCPALQCRAAARPHSERCCGMPARSARTSVSRYLR